MRSIPALYLGILLTYAGGCSRPPTGPESAYRAWLNKAPSPSDSVIIESKTVNIGTASPAAVVRVFITNKDTLTAFSLALVERSRSGGAYLTLSHPRNFDGVVTPLTGTLQFYLSKLFNGYGYNSNSPDTFAVVGTFDPTDIASLEPPNWTRKAFFEIKFDTALAGPTGGVVEFDNAWIRNYATGFVDQRPEDIKPNFVKGTITVTAPNPSPVSLTKPNNNESL